MPYEQLIQSVDESADDKIQEIRESASQRAAEIQQEAVGRGEILKKKYMEAAKRDVEVERGKSIAHIKKETRMQLIRAKDEVYQLAFSEAWKYLSSAREQANYENSFSKMLQEVIVELEGETIVLQIDERDESLCKKLLRQLNGTCEIITDIKTAGGLDARTKDDKFVVFNTIESRLGRAKVLLKPEIFATLYGGQGGV
jgi:V/A-type H+-transporting ATPase subunit E